MLGKLPPQAPSTHISRYKVPKIKRCIEFGSSSRYTPVLGPSAFPIHELKLNQLDDANSQGPPMKHIRMLSNRSCHLTPNKPTVLRASVLWLQQIGAISRPAWWVPLSWTPKDKLLTNRSSGRSLGLPAGS